MKARAAILCLALGAPSWGAAAPACNLAAAPDVPVIKGLPYDQARKALLAGGWRPGHGSQFADLSGNQSVFHDRGYTELRSCEFSQGTPCRFEFVAKGDVVLTVTTTGEENPVLDAQARVSDVDLNCAK